MQLEAAILDVDGVLTRTAVVHEEAWRQVFDPVLAEHGDRRPFTHADYLAHVDGKPRDDGLNDFLASRRIRLTASEGRRLATRKNEIFLALVRERGADVYADTVDEVERWRRHGLAIAFVSASKNAEAILRSAKLDTLCDVLLTGLDAARAELDGKAALFRHAARRLDVEPGRALVVEDAVAGVRAAAAGGFALVVGLSRAGADPQALSAAGAHRVVASLSDLEGIVRPGSRPAASLPWALHFDRVDVRVGELEPAILLDFDGTLAPIVPYPDDAAIPDAARELVAALAARFPVAIVSGRDRADVARRVGIPGIWYAGSHGFEISDPQGQILTRDEAYPALAPLAEAERVLARELGDVPGVTVERKAFALALHYRRATDEVADRVIARAVAIADAEPALRVHRDQKVIELRPDVDWDKGRAIGQILSALGVSADDTVPVYVGDGPTDEDAFRALEGGGIGVLVGAPRRPTHAALRLRDQDEVVLFLRELVRFGDRARYADEWTLRYEGWDPQNEGLREALCTLGNGNFATRGAAEEATADDVHYPGTYWAGGYDRVATEIRGEVLENEDLVNWPNWLRLSFRPKGGSWLSPQHFEILDHRQDLDLRRGILTRRLRVRDPAGRETSLLTSRIVSMDDPNIGAIAWVLTPQNWEGRIEIRSALDGTVQNRGVARYRELRGDHLVPRGSGVGADESIWLDMRTRQSRIAMAQAARTRITSESHAPRHRRVFELPDRVEERIDVDVAAGQPLRLEKVVTLQVSRDPAISEPLADARERLRRAPDYHELASDHARRLAELWRRCDIRLGPGRERENRILRLHIFHLLQVVSPHIIHRDTGVPARGLHGEAYRGHVFWDELFIFPFLNLRIPELTRELLMYRYLRLGAAKALAHGIGCAGAAFPWQSGSSGREESQVLHLNPRSGRWIPDATQRQRHINAAVAWNVWQYVETTDDREFLSYYGAEMLLEIARFWASAASWDEGEGRYRIRGVVGPDEFHTRYPGADGPGIDDNAYTNVMASWCLRTAERALARLDHHRRHELLDHLGITDRDRRRWHNVATKLRVGFHGGHIISQFDGYEDLEELDWDDYRARYGDIHRLDRILEAEGDSPNRYKASKQADVLMLFFLFTDEGVIEQLRFMGYELRPEHIPDNIDYYLSRTSHGSTLSSMIHSWVIARHDRAQSWRLFETALRADVDDIQGGTTPEGIHLGAMAGTVDLAQRGYTGANIEGDVLWLSPQLPEEMPELCLCLRFRGALLAVTIAHDQVAIDLYGGEADTARIGLYGEVYELRRGEPRHFPARA